MRVVIVAASDDALGRASQLWMPGVVLHRVSSLARATDALQAEPHIDPILIDAASDILRGQGASSRPGPLPQPYPMVAQQ
ncbi:MAG: hypothetical protein ACREJ0_04735 [Geminicoccaceae bacterium]